MTLFALHMPTRLFQADPAGALAAATGSIMRSLNSVLAEPIEDCLLDPGCIEVMGPLEIEARLGMPGGNIFHRDAAVAVRRAPGGRRPLGRRDRPSQPLHLRRRRPPRRRRLRHPRPQRRHGRAGGETIPALMIWLTRVAVLAVDAAVVAAVGRADAIA